MKFEGTKTMGVENALIGMRLPMCRDYMEASDMALVLEQAKRETVGLGCKLILADKKAKGYGQPNAKFLRMIHVQVAITAPLYWWKEFDTYKVGTTANSTSTMHKLAYTRITLDCFELDDFEDVFTRCDSLSLSQYWEHNLIPYLEGLRLRYNMTNDKRYWKELIRLLPESWLQTRMVDMDYQTVRNIYYWRKNHKLTEWHTFCKWVSTLPYAKLWLIDEEEENA